MTRERPPRAGEKCSCGRPAVIVIGDVPYCGLPELAARQPGAAVMTGHRVHLTLSPRWGIESQVVCEEPDTAPCRNYCPRPECEEGCSDEVLPVAEHRTVPTRTCNVKDWLEADDVVGCYTGPPMSPILNGPIEVTWAGESYGYEWTYAQPEGVQA